MPTADISQELKRILTQKNLPEARYYNFTDTANILDVSPRAVKVWCLLGQLDTIQIGANTRVKANSIENVLENGAAIDKSQFIQAPPRRKRTLQDTQDIILDAIYLYPDITGDNLHFLFGSNHIAEAVKCLEADGSLTTMTGGVNGWEKQYALTDKGKREAEQVRAQG